MEIPALMAETFAFLLRLSIIVRVPIRKFIGESDHVHTMSAHFEKQ